MTRSSPASLGVWTKLHRVSLDFSVPSRLLPKERLLAELLHRLPRLNRRPTHDTPRTIPQSHPSRRARPGSRRCWAGLPQRHPRDRLRETCWSTSARRTRSGSTTRCSTWPSSSRAFSTGCTPIRDTCLPMHRRASRRQSRRTAVGPTSGACGASLADTMTSRSVIRWLDCDLAAVRGFRFPDPVDRVTVRGAAGEGAAAPRDDRLCPDRRQSGHAVLPDSGTGGIPGVHGEALDRPGRDRDLGRSDAGILDRLLRGLSGCRRESGWK